MKASEPEPTQQPRFQKLGSHTPGAPIGLLVDSLPQSWLHICLNKSPGYMSKIMCIYREGEREREIRLNTTVCDLNHHILVAIAVRGLHISHLGAFVNPMLLKKAHLTGLGTLQTNIRVSCIPGGT